MHFTWNSAHTCTPHLHRPVDHAVYHLQAVTICVMKELFQPQHQCYWPHAVCRCHLVRVINCCGVLMQICRLRNTRSIAQTPLGATHLLQVPAAALPQKAVWWRMYCNGVATLVDKDLTIISHHSAIQLDCAQDPPDAGPWDQLRDYSHELIDQSHAVPRQSQGSTGHRCNCC